MKRSLAGVRSRTGLEGRTYDLRVPTSAPVSSVRHLHTCRPEAMDRASQSRRDPSEGRSCEEGGVGESVGLDITDHAVRMAEGKPSSPAAISASAFRYLMCVASRRKPMLETRLTAGNAVSPPVLSAVKNSW
jgi:hypothetical protein